MLSAFQTTYVYTQDASMASAPSPSPSALTDSTTANTICPHAHIDSPNAVFSSVVPETAVTAHQQGRQQALAAAQPSSCGCLPSLLLAGCGRRLTADCWLLQQPRPREQSGFRARLQVGFNTKLHQHASAVGAYSQGAGLAGGLEGGSHACAGRLFR